MSSTSATWPLPNMPTPNSRVVLASQGVRIWKAECRLEALGETLHLICADSTTSENLRHQQRVAFTILDADSGQSTQGSGIAHLCQPAVSGKATIEVEPYRLSAGPEHIYELRLGGWSKVSETRVPAVSRFAFWYQAFRAVTLPMSALPVLVGAAAAFARGQFNWLFLVLALVGTVLAHAGANATADYFDFKKGVDRSRALSSHLGALARERVEPEMILLAAFACFLGTTLIGLVLLLLVGWPILLFGMIGLLGAFFYTGRPISYKYRAMGELMLGLLMGPVIVMGSFYLHTLSWDWALFLVSVALAMLVSSVSLANNLRDVPDDRAAAIRTLPMLLGVSMTKKLYYFLSACPYVLSAASILVNHAFWPIMLVVISLPQAIKTIQDLHSTRDDVDDIRQKSLRHPYPLNSIRLHIRFAFLTAISIVLAGVIRLIV